MTKLLQNIAPIPLLWIVPLSAYLLSLILCFDSDRWYDRRVWLPLMIAVAAWMTYELFPNNQSDYSFHLQSSRCYFLFQ